MSKTHWLRCAALLVLFGCTKKQEATETSSADTKKSDAAKGVGTSVAGQERGKGPRKGGGGGGRPTGPVSVRVSVVEGKITPRMVAAVAPLAGRVQADVFSKVTGRVSFMGPREGQPVKAGDVLFRIDRSDPGESYLNVPVLSPLTGWLGRWRVINLGEQVTAADPVVTIVDDRGLKAVAFLSAADWLDVTSDTQVTALVNDQVRPAKIETIARSADLTSGRGSVTVSLENPNRDWRAGMYARLNFAIAPKERLLVSAASLILTDRGAFVYVVEGETAKRVQVKYLMIDSDTVEVTEGLKINSQVVTAGGNLLSDQTAVKVLN